jgi:hypothetical protein
MSVRWVRGSPYWHFRFKHQGIEFRASTRTTDQQVAEAIEHAEREKVKRIGVNTSSFRGTPKKDRESAAQ